MGWKQVNNQHNHAEGPNKKQHWIMQSLNTSELFLGNFDEEENVIIHIVGVMMAPTIQHTKRVETLGRGWKEGHQEGSHAITQHVSLHPSTCS
jgi:hypothetical protein